MRAQMPLPLEPGRKPRFENFVSAAAGREVALLQDWLATDDGDLCVVTGPPGSGKTHLLLAALAAWTESGRPARYVPLGSTSSWPPPSALAGGLLVIDDLDLLAAAQALELVRAIDAARAGRWRLLLASRASTAALDLPFEDLRSRLQWGARLPLLPLAEQGLGTVLQLRAAELGVQWPPRNTEYLLRRLPREPAIFLQVFTAVYRRAISEGRALGLGLLAEVLQTAQFAAAVQQTGSEPQAGADQQTASR